MHGGVVEKLRHREYGGIGRPPPPAAGDVIRVGHHRMRHVRLGPHCAVSLHKRLRTGPSTPDASWIAALQREENRCIWRLASLCE